jgi:hypothetical protein
VYLNAIGRLIIDFHRSKFDLLLVGIRLQYQYFREPQFFTDTGKSVIETQLRLVVWNRDHTSFNLLTKFQVM